MSYYEKDGTKLYYCVCGQGKPMLIVHGWAIDHCFCQKALEPIFEKLSFSIMRIYVDLPGMGRSMPGNIRNGEDIAEFLGKFMDYLLPDTNYYLYGNSFGSVVCRAMAAKFSKRVEAMLLIGPAKDRFDKNTRLPESGICTEDKDFVMTLSEEEKRSFLCMHANHTREIFDRYKEMVEPSIRINADNDFLHNTLKGSFSFDINKMIKKNHYHGPVLLLTGKYDMAVGYEDQREWLDIFDRAKYVVIDGAGHNIHIDQPEIFEREIISFIEEYL